MLLADSAYNLLMSQRKYRAPPASLEALTEGMPLRTAAITTESALVGQGLGLGAAL